jgi:hypothetical protein
MENKMLELKLTPDLRFLHDELKKCKAEIELKPNTAESGDPNDVTAKGVFRLMDTGNAVDCVITASGCIEEAIDVANPAVIKAKLTADFERTMVFTAGSCDTGIPVKADASLNNKVKVNGTDATVTESGDTVVLGASGVDGKVTVTFEGVEVASGVGEDPLCDGSFKIDPVGEVHIDAVCSYAKPHDLKPNPTHMRIRAVDPHKKVITLGVNDGEYTPDGD